MSALTNTYQNLSHFKGISFDEATFTATPARTGTRALNGNSVEMLDANFASDGANNPTIQVGPLSDQNYYNFEFDNTVSPIKHARLIYGSTVAGNTGNANDIRRLMWDSTSFDRVVGVWIKMPSGLSVDNASVGGVRFFANGNSAIINIGPGKTNGQPAVAIVHGTSEIGTASINFYTSYTDQNNNVVPIEWNKWYFIAVRKTVNESGNVAVNSSATGTLVYDHFIDGNGVGGVQRTGWTKRSINAIVFGNNSAPVTSSVGVSSFFISDWSAIGQAELRSIYSSGLPTTTINAQPMTASLETVMPSNIIAIYRPETINGYLADTIVGYSPEHYYKFNETLTGMSKPPIVNYGTVVVPDGTVGSYFNTFPTVNATGGLKKKGSWVFNYSAGALCPRITLSTTSTQLADRNWSAGLFFKTNFTTPAITHDTAGYQLWSVGSTSKNVVISFVGGTSTNTNKGKLQFAVTGGSTFTSTARYDDQAWHYLAIRAVLTGSTITYEFYIDGSLLTTTTVADTSATSGTFQFGDSTVSAAINGTNNNTFELSDAYVAPYTTIAAPQITQIWYAANNPPTPTPVNRTHQAEPLIVSTSTILQPVITTVQGDNVQSTTSFEIDAVFPSPSFSTGDNVTVNIEAFEMVNVSIGDNISVETGADAVIPSTELTASALIVDPIVSRPAMTATALLPMPVIYVAPNYFTLVKNLNPLYYISDGQAIPTNNGSWTVNDWTIEYIDDNVTSGEEMSTVGTGKSWRGNANGVILHAPKLRGNITNYQTLVANLYATKSVSVEFWYNSIGRPRLPGLNYVESGAIFNDGITQIAEVYDWWGCTGDAPLYKQVLVGGLTDATFGLEEDQTVTVTYRTYDNANVEFDDWNHVVVTYEAADNINQVRQKVYLNGSIIYNAVLNISTSLGENNIDFTLNSPTFTGPTVGYQMGISGSQSIKLNDNVRVDEIAIYPITLSSTQVTEHYSFIKSLSPNENIFSPVIELNGQMGNHLAIAQVNFVYEATPAPASGVMVQPTVIAGISINHIAQTMDNSSELVYPGLSLGVNLPAQIDVVYAEMNPAFPLSSIYYDYVQANITPYRYVTFDDANPYLDFGSDDDYAVAPVVVGGTFVNPGIGINGKSVKTTGNSYVTDGVILKESVHDDDWGVSANNYSSSFWMQRAADDTSTGLRILANAYGYGTGDYFLLYHYQNKLHFEFKNSTTLIKQTSASNVNIFDFGTHFIALDLDHSGQTDTAKIYVDAVLVMTINIGTARLSLINGTPHTAPNDEANNHPRYSVGCLITPFNQTALPVVPTNTKLIVDEIFWDKDSLSLAQVAALYNMMPGKTNSVQTPLPLEASALFVMPAISTNVNYIGTAVTADGELLDPTLYVVKNNDFTADFMSADATMPGAARRDNVTVQAEFMLASCSIGGAGTPRLIDAAPCTATIDIINRRGTSTGFGIRVNGFSVFNSVSAWVTYVRLQNQDSIIPSGSVR
jgi:hypothetical protein